MSQLNLQGGPIPDARHRRLLALDYFTDGIGLKRMSEACAFPSYLGDIPDPDEYPFFDFLTRQRDLDRDDLVGDLMRDCFYGVDASEDPVVRTPKELRDLLEPYSAMAAALDQLVREWRHEE